MRFIGLDLTDNHAKTPRDVDIAIVDEELRCELHRVPAASVFNVSSSWLQAFTDGPKSGDVLVIDGPLCLASAGNSTRECERQLGTPGHTGDTLPVAGTRPFAGYVRSAVELSWALHAAGWTHVPDDSLNATMLEAYPGAAWRKLAGGALPNKCTKEGVRQRHELLEANGLIFPKSPTTHDEVDAALCALIGVFARKKRARVALVGHAPSPSPASGDVREGFIVTIAGTASASADPGPPKPPKPPPDPPTDAPARPSGGVKDACASFATGARAGFLETAELASREGILCRTAHAENGALIPNVGNVLPGHSIMLAYGRDANYEVIGRFIVQAPVDLVARAPGLHRIADARLKERLAENYPVDPIENVHTVLLLEADWLASPAEHIKVDRPPGMMTIWRGYPPRA